MGTPSPVGTAASDDNKENQEQSLNEGRLSDEKLRRSQARDGQRLYVIGGLDNSFAALDLVQRLDPTKHAWESLPPINSPRSACAAVVAGDFVYVFGGEISGQALSVVERFDPNRNVWDQLEPMIEHRIRPTTIFAHGFIYVLGGSDGTNSMTSVERYDIATNTWQTVSAMNRPRYACGATVQGGKILVFGGELAENGALASSEVYDPETDIWTPLPAVRTPLCGSSLLIDASGNAAYAIGGLGLSGHALGVVERISLGPLIARAGSGPLPSWAHMPQMPTPRQLVSSTTFQGGFVAVGGKTVTSDASAKVEYFNASLGSWQELIPLPLARIRAAVVAASQ